MALHSTLELLLTNKFMIYSPLCNGLKLKKNWSQVADSGSSP